MKINELAAPYVENHLIRHFTCTFSQIKKEEEFDADNNIEEHTQHF